MRVISFKPRTRVGQDASESVRRQSSYLFQSTCPVWAGRKWGGIPTGITQFRSTCPVGGRTMVCGSGDRGCGGSIRTPRRGATNDVAIAVQMGT